MNWLYAKNLSTMTNRLIVAYDINQYPSDLGHIPYSVVIWICNAYMTTFCTRTKTMWPVFCAARLKVGLSQIGIYKKRKWLTGNMEVPINVQTHPQSMVGKAGKKTKNTYIPILSLVLWMLAKYCTTNRIVISTPYFLGNNLSTGAFFFPFAVSLYRFSVTDLRINPTGSHLSVARRRRHTVKNWTAVTRRRCAVSAVQ